MLNQSEWIPVFRMHKEQQRTLSTNRHLLMEIAEKSVTIALYDVQNKEFEGLEHYHLPGTYTSVSRQIEDFLLTHEWTRTGQFVTWIMFSTSDALIFPEELHDVFSQELTIQTLCGDLMAGDVINETIEGTGNCCVFRVPASLYDLIGSKYGEEASSHLLGTLVRYQHLVPVFGTQMEVSVGNGKITVLVHQQGKLQLAQSYSWQESTDVAYHLLQIVQALHLDVETTPVYIGGMVEKDSPLFTEIRKYFREVQFSHWPEWQHFPDEWRQYPPHYFLNMAKLATCVSSAAS